MFCFVGFIFLLPQSVGLATGPGVHGRVFGHNEKGAFLEMVQGATIVFQNPPGVKIAQCKSDQNGYYKVDLPQGEYYYRIEAANYRTEDNGRGMRLEQTDGYAILNLSLTQCSSTGGILPRHRKSGRVSRRG